MMYYCCLAQATYLRGFYADEEVMVYVRSGQLVLEPWTDLAARASSPFIEISTL